MSFLSTIQNSSRARWLTVVVAILVSIAFVGTDSWKRFRRIDASMAGTMGTPFPAIDPSSPTGYEHGMRRVILPQVGIDGCHWIMHTQKMLANGDWRIRVTDNDNAPVGREIHWSHGFIWWLVILGKIHSTFTGLPLAASVETVAPFANTLILVVLIATLPWLVFKHFGPLASAALALGLSFIYAFFEFFIVGNVDHHGIAAAGALSSGLLLAVGGAGWVFNDIVRNLKGSRNVVKSKYEYLVDLSTAHRYFIGSAIAGSVSLWVSAATAVPTFLGIGFGVLCSVILFGRDDPNGQTRYVPELWRWWGIAGCCGSLFFYLLEYFPSHMGMRLEVNHPLYALAWLGGGEILTRLARWRVHGTRPWQGKAALPISIAAFLMVALLPTLIKLYPEQFFWIADDFLWKFHQDYIHEFRNIVVWASTRSSIQALISVLSFPLIGLIVFRLLMLSELGPSWRGILVLIIFPAILVTCLGMIQVRWLGIANALWLPAIPTCLGCIFGTGFPHLFAKWERVVGVAIVGFLYLIFPQGSLRDTLHSIGKPPGLGPEEAFGIYIRDLSHALKRSNPEREFVVLSGPTTTTYMMYYGGMKGIGTLYWENIQGLKSAARIYAAKTEPESRELSQRHHVSHIAIFASDAFAFEYTRLLRGLPFGTQAVDAFIPSMINNFASPVWLKPLHFQPPSELKNEWVVLLETRFGQSEAQAHYGVAEYHESKGDIAAAATEYERAIKLDPEYRDAWVRLATLLLNNDGGEKSREVLERGLVNRTPEEITDLCGAIALKCYENSKHAEAVYLLRRALQATPAQPAASNALAWLLATSFDDAVRNPVEALTLAQGNVTLASKTTYLDTLAAAQAANGDLPGAIATIMQAIEYLKTQPDGENDPMLKSLVEHLGVYQTGNPIRTGRKN